MEMRIDVESLTYLKSCALGVLIRARTGLSFTFGYCWAARMIRKSGRNDDLSSGVILGSLFSIILVWHGKVR